MRSYLSNRSYFLIKAVIVSVTLGLPLALLTYCFFQPFSVDDDDAKHKRARRRMLDLASQINYWADTNSGPFPEVITEFELDVAAGTWARDPFTERIFLYERTDAGYRLTSFGADGEPGGTDADADIVIDYVRPRSP